MPSNNPIDPATLRGNWNYPTIVLFGIGRIAELPEACSRLGMKQPLLVTDPGLASLPMVQEAVTANEAAGLPTGLFSNIRANPSGTNIEDGVRAFKLGDYDGVIAFGGGSALDAGKAIAFMAGQDRPIWDFEDIGDNFKRANTAHIAPVVAVPTTSGTGSEVGRASVITDEIHHVKRIIFHPRMQPGIAIDDPALTVGLPPGLTAATGMDALAHNLEALCGPFYHPMADGIAVEAIRLIARWLPVAVRDGTNLEARSQMMAASTMGATAFQKALGAIHAMSHPLGALYDLHHGTLNGVVMPYVMEFNRDAIEERMVRLAGYMGLSERSYDAVLDWVLGLRRETGIPHTLGELGVGTDRISELTRMGLVDPSAGGNPVPLDETNLSELFLRSIEGRM